jgi:hypothetical protein
MPLFMDLLLATSAALSLTGKKSGNIWIEIA